MTNHKYQTNHNDRNPKFQTLASDFICNLVLLIRYFRFIVVRVLLFQILYLICIENRHKILHRNFQVKKGAVYANHLKFNAHSQGENRWFTD